MPSIIIILSLNIKSFQAGKYLDSRHWTGFVEMHQSKVKKTFLIYKNTFNFYKKVWPVPFLAPTVLQVSRFHWFTKNDFLIPHKTFAPVILKQLLVLMTFLIMSKQNGRLQCQDYSQTLVTIYFTIFLFLRRCWCFIFVLQDLLFL